MLYPRKSSDRGAADHGWLKAKHSFSFGDYYDADNMRFGPLVVINEDRVQPSQGFGVHGHRDMEIISYVLKGALEHKDSMGNGSVLHYGDVQRMSAGTGVHHSEFNHSSTELVHFFQIWVEPNVTDIVPSYQEENFPPESKRNQLRLIASSDGRDGSILVHQDVAIYASILDGGKVLEHQIQPGRKAYVLVLRGELTVCGVRLGTGDALKLIDENLITLSEAADVELLVFDVT